jgi:hypothetical protein
MNMKRKATTCEEKNSSQQITEQHQAQKKARKEGGA